MKTSYQSHTTENQRQLLYHPDLLTIIKTRTESRLNQEYRTALKTVRSLKSLKDNQLTDDVERSSESPTCVFIAVG